MSLQTFILSSELDLPVKVRFASLFNIPIPTPASNHPLLPTALHSSLSAWDLDNSIDFYFTIEITSGGLSLTPTPTFSQLYTTSATVDPTAYSHRVDVDEWFTLPIVYKDLPPNAMFVINVWSLSCNYSSFLPPPNSPQNTIMQKMLKIDNNPQHFSTESQFIKCLGGTTCAVFNKSGRMKHGVRRLYITPHTVANPLDPTQTPAKQKKNPQLPYFDNVYGPKAPGDSASNALQPVLGVFHTGLAGAQNVPNVSTSQSIPSPPVSKSNQALSDPSDSRQASSTLQSHIDGVQLSSSNPPHNRSDVPQNGPHRNPDGFVEYSFFPATQSGPTHEQYDSFVRHSLLSQTSTITTSTDNLLNSDSVNIPWMNALRSQALQHHQLSPITSTITPPIYSNIQKINTISNYNHIHPQQPLQHLPSHAHGITGTDSQQNALNQRSLSLFQSSLSSFGTTSSFPIQPHQFPGHCPGPQPASHLYNPPHSQITPICELIISMAPFRSPVIYSQPDFPTVNPFKQQLRSIDDAKRTIVSLDPESSTFSPIQGTFQLLASGMTITGEPILPPVSDIGVQWNITRKEGFEGGTEIKFNKQSQLDPTPLPLNNVHNTSSSQSQPHTPVDHQPVGESPVVINNANSTSNINNTLHTVTNNRNNTATVNINPTPDSSSNLNNNLNPNNLSYSQLAEGRDQYGREWEDMRALAAKDGFDLSYSAFEIPLPNSLSAPLGGAHLAHPYPHERSRVIHILTQPTPPTAAYDQQLMLKYAHAPGVRMYNENWFKYLPHCVQDWDPQTNARQINHCLYLLSPASLTDAERATVSIGTCLHVLLHFTYTPLRCIALQLLNSFDDATICEILLQLVQIIRLEPLARGVNVSTMNPHYNPNYPNFGLNNAILSLHSSLFSKITQNTTPVTPHASSASRSVQRDSVQTRQRNTTTPLTSFITPNPSVLPQTLHLGQLHLLRLQKSQPSNQGSTIFFSGRHVFISPYPQPQSLPELLIQRALLSPVICNQLYWFFKVESLSPTDKLFKQLLILLTNALCLTGQRSFNEMIRRQSNLLKRTIQIFHQVKNKKGPNKVADKVAYFRQLLNETDPTTAQYWDLSFGSEKINLPINPSIIVQGLKVEKCAMFKSAKTPLLLTYYLYKDMTNASTQTSSTGLGGEDQGDKAQNANPSILQHITDFKKRKGVLTTQPSPAHLEDLSKMDTYRVMFKCGDDLRQDQLVVSLFRAMTTILNKHQFDMEILTYNVIATSPDDGYVEFVNNSKTVQDIVRDTKKNIRAFTAACELNDTLIIAQDRLDYAVKYHTSTATHKADNNQSVEEIVGTDESEVNNNTNSVEPVDLPDTALTITETPLPIAVTSPQQVEPVVQNSNPSSTPAPPQPLYEQMKHSPHRSLMTYIKSLAGYCVMTFILGIGDRHLENILINNRSQLFHIDFGFIFGKDPKPYPPAFKLTKEMVEAMGGEQSSGYRIFQTYCCIAYSILRKEGSYLMDLLSAMITAGLPDFDDPDTRLNFVRNRLCVGLPDELCDPFFQQHITDSLHARIAVMSDMVHEFVSARG